ncbi:helix-turn-helix transcriptional regulator [Actinomycetospora lutea]|uniref:helix-turn-helix domain-containing protein n=1 Tax=Actinomycetospora lutea TaxID=663604 RepID=UPI002365879D|nr:helix-turn-helix transcriptional regulator [Actinomycetospora lutea]MDD7937950.1 helix-turn-helix transcriptional regulator [Actinomycetospora lutea]
MLRILVGIQLRRLREQCGMSREAAADIIRGSEAKMSRLELGRTGFKQRDVVDLLSAYGVTDDAEREAVLSLARRANEPGWWQSYNDVMPGWLEMYVGLEQAASIIRSYEAQFVPGLLQTEAYARSVIGLGQVARADDVKERVALRLRRQQILDDPAGPDLWVVIDEAVLRRTMGDTEVMRGQLDHLLTMMKRPRVTVQIVPFARSGQVATGGPFTLLRFAEPDLPDIVYLEQLTSAFYVDKRDDVETYLELIDRLSATALTPAESTDVVAAARATI